MEATNELLRAIVARARADRHRGLLALRGSGPSRDALTTVLASAELTDVVWIGGAGGVPIESARGLLGAEHDAVVLDLRERLDPDAVGAVHGAIRAGGVLVLRMPEPIAVWRGRFGARAARVIERHAIAPAPTPLPPAPAPASGTDEQRGAVARLDAMIASARPEPVVLVADRGRGKSAALGMAAGAALARGLDVRVVAPRPASIDALVRFAQREAETRGIDASTIERRLRYVGPRPPAADEPDPHVLWLVDEAAALPVALLRYLAKAPRVAFATTVHGYEGTGRGFTERFLRSLIEARPSTVVHALSEPIRWAAGDPVEALAFDLLLLDAAPAPASVVSAASMGAIELVRVDRDRLALDEDLLRALFGLLVAAHYRTSPRDLVTLLDAPNVELHAAFHGGHAVAAAMVAIEGGLPSETIDSMLRGLARPSGHALPETLVAHGREPDAGRLSGARIVRLAVHAAARRRGLGRALVDAVIEDAGARELDWVGALFGVTPELLAFWMRAGFVPVRLSVSRGRSSGEHSAAVLRACSPAGSGLITRLRAAFAEDLPAQLADPLRRLEPELALTALRGAPWREPRLSDRQLEQLVASAVGGLPYGVAVDAMRELVGATIHAPVPGLDDAARRALVLKVLQHREWEEVASELDVGSVPNAMRAVRAALRPLVLAFGGARARELAASFERKR